MIISRKLEYVKNNQNGFTRRRTYLTNLLMILEDWTQTIKPVIYLDISKAFHSVQHIRLYSIEKIR